MTRNESHKLCLSLGEAEVFMPLRDRLATIFRRCDNRKWLALIKELDSELCVNLKGNPVEN